MENFAVARSIFFRSIFNGSPLRTFSYRGRDVFPLPQCHPVLEGAVFVVRPLQDIVALMSDILISVQTFIRPKCLVSRHRDVRHLGYDIHFSLLSLEFRTFFFFCEGGRNPAAGPQLTLNTQVRTNTLLAHVKV
jgi:hypothetical protein